MALKKCKDCGEQVSTSATACPKCGAPIKKRISGCAAILVIGLVLIVIGIVIRSISGPSPATPSSSSEPPTKEQVADNLAESAKAQGWGKEKDPIWLKTKAGKVWERHQTWPPKICESVARREVYVGMAAEQVRAAWGKPDHINTTSTGTVEHEQWVWGSSQYAYFEDGFLTSVQQSK